LKTCGGSYKVLFSSFSICYILPLETSLFLGELGPHIPLQSLPLSYVNLLISCRCCLYLVIFVLLTHATHDYFKIISISIFYAQAFPNIVAHKFPPDAYRTRSEMEIFLCSYLVSHYRKNQLGLAHDPISFVSHLLNSSTNYPNSCLQPLISHQIVDDRLS